MKKWMEDAFDRHSTDITITLGLMMIWFVLGVVAFVAAHS